MGTVNPEWVEAGADVLNDSGGAPGSALHSWRCSDSQRYPDPCTCVAEIVADILAAVEPLIRADERERVFSGVQWRHAVGANTYSVECLTGLDDECEWCLCFCHAEAVAARLVEVICEQEWRIHGLNLLVAEDGAEIRAQIAADIEALGATFEAGQPILVDRNYVVRIARGTA